MVLDVVRFFINWEWTTNGLNLLFNIKLHRSLYDCIGYANST